MVPINFFFYLLTTNPLRMYFLMSAFFNLIYILGELAMRSNYSSALYNCCNNYGLSELLAEVLDLF